MLSVGNEKLFFNPNYNLNYQELSKIIHQKIPVSRENQATSYLKCDFCDRSFGAKIDMKRHAKSIQKGNLEKGK